VVLLSRTSRRTVRIPCIPAIRSILSTRKQPIPSRCLSLRTATFRISPSSITVIILQKPRIRPFSSTTKNMEASFIIHVRNPSFVQGTAKTSSSISITWSRSSTIISRHVIYSLPPYPAQDFRPVLFWRVPVLPVPVPPGIRADNPEHALPRSELCPLHNTQPRGPPPRRRGGGPRGCVLCRGDRTSTRLNSSHVS